MYEFHAGAIWLPKYFFVNRQVNHSKESMNAVAIEKTVKIPCSELDTTLRKTGYWFGDCRGNLGNQVLVLGTGLNMYLQSGAKLVIGKSHADKLRAAFDVEKICKDDGSTFCIIWPQGTNFWLMFLFRQMSYIETWLFVSAYLRCLCFCNFLV